MLMQLVNKLLLIPYFYFLDFNGGKNSQIGLNKKPKTCLRNLRFVKHFFYRFDNIAAIRNPFS